jgi:hypothetical protein
MIFCEIRFIPNKSLLEIRWSNRAAALRRTQLYLRAVADKL